jgi:hypothetical protein
MKTELKKALYRGLQSYFETIILGHKDLKSRVFSINNKGGTSSRLNSDYTDVFAGVFFL